MDANSQLDTVFQPLKYQFFDDGAKGLLNNDDVTLTMWYNTVPNAGMLPLVPAIGSHKIGFGEYASKKY